MIQTCRFNKLYDEFRDNDRKNAELYDKKHQEFTKKYDFLFDYDLISFLEFKIILMA